MNLNSVNESRFCRILPSEFIAPVVMRNAHLQTITPKFLFRQVQIPFKQERVKSFDGDFIDLAWHVPTSPRAIVILFHGLEGSAQSHYIRFLAKKLFENDFGCVVMHFRGCSGEVNTKPISYHSGAIFDPEHIIPLVKQRYSALPLFAVGYSLGGNMLMNLMALRGDLPVEASICVSAPLDLSASSDAINQGFAKQYQQHLMKSMKRNLLNKMQRVDMRSLLNLPQGDYKEAISKMTTFREFDDAVTAPLHGFDDANDYYRKCSGLQFLYKIRKPTLIIHAKDDPFMDERVMPNIAQISRSIAYEYSEHGGHVGFVQSLSGNDKTWLPTRIVSFLNEILGRER